MFFVELQLLSDVACYPSPNGPPSHKPLWCWAAIDGGVHCSATSTKAGLGAPNPIELIAEMILERGNQGDFWVTEALRPPLFRFMVGEVLVSYIPL